VNVLDGNDELMLTSINVKDQHKLFKRKGPT